MTVRKIKIITVMTACTLIFTTSATSCAKNPTGNSSSTISTSASQASGSSETEFKPEVSDVGVPQMASNDTIMDSAIMFGAGNDEFPIGLWCPSSYKHFNEAVYKDIAAANYNFVIGLDEIYGGQKMMLDALDYAEKYNIKMWLNDPFLRKLTDKDAGKILESIKPYLAKKAFLGVIFQDEPGLAAMETLVPFDKEFKRVAPATMPLINLLPDYAALSQMGTTSWENYLDSYIKLFSPKYIMYDSYPLTFESDNMGYGLIKSMSIINKKAQAKNIPLWTNIQSIPLSLDARDLTATDLKWSMYMNLALGSKSITYWPYAVSFEQGDDVKPAIIDIKGKKTPLYDEATKLNKEVKNMGQILLRMQFKGVMINSNKNPIQDYELDSFAPIKSFSGGEFMIGCFDTSSGSKKLMVTNMGIKEAVNANITFLRDNVAYYYIWRDGVRIEKFMPTDNTLNIPLRAGEGVLIELGPAKG